MMNSMNQQLFLSHLEGSRLAHPFQPAEKRQ